MSGQYFGERKTASDIVDANTPLVNSDLFTDRVPVDAALIQEVPMGGTVAAVAPINEAVTDEIPLYETPIQEIPMGGTVAAVGPMAEPVTDEFHVVETPVRDFPKAETGVVVPMDEPIVHEALITEALPYKAPYDETLVDEAKVIEPIPYKLPESEVITRETPVVTASASPAALLTHEESERFRTNWNEIQGKFVDEPRAAVQQADTLVSEVIGQITQMFSKEHSVLEGQWKQGNDVSTEDLRKALQRYRSFFNRLVV